MLTPGPLRHEVEPPRALYGHAQTSTKATEAIPYRPAAPTKAACRDPRAQLAIHAHTAHTWGVPSEHALPPDHTIGFDKESDANAALDETLKHMNETGSGDTVKIAGKLAIRVGSITSAKIYEGGF